MYDPLRRTYTHKGITYRSVTTIIDREPKQALVAWAAKIATAKKEA